MLFAAFLPCNTSAFDFCAECVKISVAIRPMLDTVVFVYALDPLRLGACWFGVLLPYLPSDLAATLHPGTRDLCY